MSSYIKLLRFFAGFSMIYLLIVLCINIWADPFGLRAHGGRRSHSRMVKAIRVNQLDPEAVFVGSSSVAIGLDPDHEVLSDYDSVYNLGIFGANFYELKHYFQHAASSGHLKSALVSLDFYGFNQFSSPKPGFSKARLNSRLMHPEDFFKLYLSLEALQLAKNPGSAETDYFAPDGLLKELENWSIEDRQDLFTKHLRQNFLEEGGMYHGQYALSQDALNDFADLVKIADDQGIELQIFLPPSHVTLFYNLLNPATYWQTYQAWLTAIVDIHPVWDFSGCNSVTTKSVDFNEDYYEDPLHFTPKVGDWIIERSYAQAGQTVPSDFGTYVTADTIDAHIQQIKQQCESWRQDNPETIEWLESLNLKSTLVSSVDE